MRAVARLFPDLSVICGAGLCMMDTVKFIAIPGTVCRWANWACLRILFLLLPLIQMITRFGSVGHRNSKKVSYWLFCYVMDTGTLNGFKGDVNH